MNLIVLGELPTKQNTFVENQTLKENEFLKLGQDELKKLQHYKFKQFWRKNG